MDGARLPNAVVAAAPPAAQGAHARALGRCADSVMTSLTKGLGAPVGAVLAGPQEFLERAHLLRKRLGGWMRQAGVIAAAGLHALEHHLGRLAEDHRLAAALAELFAPYQGFQSWPGEIESNIVMVRITRPGWSPERFTAELAEQGVWTLPMSADSVRFVTHLDVGPRDLERLDAALRRIL